MVLCSIWTDLAGFAPNLWIGPSESEAALLKPSWLGTGKLVTIPESLTLRALGRLTSDDRNSVQEPLGVVVAH